MEVIRISELPEKSSADVADIVPVVDVSGSGYVTKRTSVAGLIAQAVAAWWNGSQDKTKLDNLAASVVVAPGKVLTNNNSITISSADGASVDIGAGGSVLYANSVVDGNLANIIKHKRSATPGSTPSTEDLFLGELAINSADGKVFMKKTDGTILDLTNSGSVDGGELQYDSLLQGLMGFWLFENNVGHVDDVSGNEVKLYEALSAQNSPGKVGSALRLDKRDFYYAQSNLAGHRTISVWLKLAINLRGEYDAETSYSSGDAVVFNDGLWVLRDPSAVGVEPSSDNYDLIGSVANELVLLKIDNFDETAGVRLVLSPDGEVGWVADVNGNQTPLMYSSLVHSEWTHLVFVRDPDINTCRLYKNGTPLSSVIANGTVSENGSHILKIGGDNVIPVDMDCLGVWDRVLSLQEVQTLYGNGSAYSLPEPQPTQIDYEQFITVNVDEEIESISVSVVGNSNPIYPEFDAEISDYGILTSSVTPGTPVTYSVSVNGASYPGLGGVNDLIRVTNGVNDYYIRLFPSDLPIGTITTQPGADYVPGYYITTSRRDVNVNNYNIVYNEYGLPLWYVSNPGTPHLAQHGNDRNKIGVSRNGTGTRYSMEIKSGSIDTRQFNFLPTNRNGNTYSYNFGNHEFLEIKSPPEYRGNIIYNTFVTQPAAGSQAITDKAYGVYIQEQTPQNTIGWEWWTSDRFDQTNLARNASFFHMNSVDIHPVTGDMLLSCRQCSAIVCVDRATKDVKWVIQGASQPWGNIIQTANQHTLDNAKWLTLEGEPELEGYQYLGPEGQHHARWAVNVNPLTPGNDVISIFDNQSGFFPGSTNSPKTVTSLVQNGTTVTGTATGHGFVTGAYVKVVGANESIFNGVFAVTVVNSSTFTYTVATSGAATATGTITATRALTYWPHSANSPAARGVIYEIDLVNEKAIHRASAFAPNGTSGYLGSYQISLHDDGTFSHVLNFTQQHPPLVEYSDGGDGASPGDIIFAVDFPGDIYRITKVSKDYFDLDYLRATAGMTPNFIN